MILSAHQPAYLPWPGYFDKINKSDAFVILDDVQFERNSYINRNKIRVGNEAHWLTIPVHIGGHTTSTIRETRIDNGRDWKRKHWETIRHNYSRSPYWNDVADRVHDEVMSTRATIDDVWRGLNLLPLTTPIYRQSVLGITGEKQELIVNLCKHFNADAFLFGRNGRDYVDEEYFKSKGITPLFQEYEYPVYKQWGDVFVPGLSIIDMLFNCGMEGTREMICG
jgi:hypothetical protein